MSTHFRAAVAVGVVLAIGFGALATNATDRSAGAVRVAFAPPTTTSNRDIPIAPGADANVITLAAPPRDTEAEARRRFDPVAQYLSTVLGKKVVYRHPGSWGVYQGEMQRGAYDIVFDGPHFNGWRIEKLQHSIVAKVPGDLSQAVFVPKGSGIESLKQLNGRRVCAHAPPNLGTLVLQRAFDNPSRQPSIVVVEGFKNIYQSLLDGKCQAAVLPTNQLEKFDVGGDMRIVYRSATLPNQAFSAGPRLSEAERERLTAALLAPEAEGPTAKMREAYTGGKSFVAASNREYVGLADFLRNEWGY